MRRLVTLGLLGASLLVAGSASGQKVVGGNPAALAGSAGIVATQFAGTTTLTLQAFQANGFARPNVHIVQDAVTVGTGAGTFVPLVGAAAFLSATSFACAGTAVASPTPVQIQRLSGAMIQILATPGTVVDFICVGT